MKGPFWTLGERDTVVASWGEYARGPGWSNSPILVVVRRAQTGTLELEFLQPNEQPPEMLELFEVSAVVAARTAAIVERHMRRLARMTKGAANAA